MSNRSLSRQPTRLQQILAALATTLIAVGSLTFMSARPAAAEANRLLDVRALGISCGFTPPSSGGTGRDDEPGRWHPSDTANNQALRALIGNPTACRTAVAAPTAGQAAAVGVDGSTASTITAAGFSPEAPAPTVPASGPSAVPAAPGAELANTGAPPILLIVGESLMVLLLGLAIVASRKHVRPPGTD